jgi:hypothetical protein
VDESNVRPLRPERHGAQDIADILSHLDQDLGQYSLDELEHVGDADLHAELHRLGIPEEEAFALPDLPDDWNAKVADAINSSVSLVPRTWVVREILDGLRDCQEIVVSGAAGSGKTVVFQRLLMDDKDVRKQFPRIIRLDCAGLRMSDPSQFSKNATWSLFGLDENAFRQFAHECHQRSRLDPLLTLLELRLASDGLFILDHMEHMNRSESMGNWLAEGLVRVARKAGFKIIFCDRSMSSLMKFHRLSPLALKEVRIDNFSRKELEDWLESTYFERINGFEVTAGDIFRVTGGSPRLIRDLANFFALYGRADKSALLKFMRRRPLEYVAHCERLIWAKRTLPAFLFKDLHELSLDHLPDQERMHIRDTLCATGVVRETQNGRFAYVSPIHRKRARLLTQTDVLSLALLRATSLSSLDSRNHTVQLRNYAEIAVDPLTQFLGSERSARLALLKLRGVLYSWGFRATLYLRDRNNARLFLALDRHEDRIFPLQDSDFVRAVQTGRSVVTDSEEGVPGELIVPTIGYTGTVELLFKGKFCSANAPKYMQEIRRDRFVNLIRGLKPTLSQILERFWAFRDRCVMEKLLYGRKDSDPNAVWQNVIESLSKAQPAALVVLRRDQDRWSVNSFQRVGRSDGDDKEIFRTSDCAQPADSVRLDRIAFHPSKRGLVLGNQDAGLIFPKLSEQKDAAVYVRPVWFKSECRLVVFMFKRAPAGGLDGSVQHRLSMAAQAIAAAS